MKKKALSLFLAALVTVTSLFGCGSGSQKSSASKYSEFLVIDVFDSLANFQGIQSGWFAKIVRDKFNMELNIIAPNVAGGGDTLYQSLCAAGDLGDLIICSGENGNVQNMIDAGLLYNMEPLLKDKQIMQYEYAIDLLNDKLTPDGIYALPSEISTSSPTKISSGQQLTYAPIVRWDYYKDLGYPEVGTLEDLLPILKEMQVAHPYTESGTRVYGFSLFPNWDANLMNAIKQPCTFYGYDEIGFVLARADGSDYQNILDDDSLYTRILKFYFTANQMGLLDPESATQDYDSVSDKFEEGAVLFSPWPWQGPPSFNTIENTAAGVGYMMVPIDDMEVFAYGCNPEGSQKSVMAIGKNTEDPERIADFIDWLYSPEGIFINEAQTSGGSAGPEGLTWNMTDNGPVLTQYGIEAFMNGDTILPEEWGGGSWLDGTSTLNYTAVDINDNCPDGYAYSYDLWDSVLAMKETSLDVDWRNVTSAYSMTDYLIDHDQIIVAPGCSFTSMFESSELSTIRNQCKAIIIDYSWRLVFAEDEASFDALLKEMQTRAMALGYEQILEIDMQNAERQNESRLAAASAFALNTES